MFQDVFSIGCGDTLGTDTCRIMHMQIVHVSHKQKPNSPGSIEEDPEVQANVREWGPY